MKTYPERQLASRFDVVIVVWGARHLGLFLDIGVPNHLAPGNLRALPPGSRYRVFTSPEDVVALESSPAVHAVSAIMAVDIVPVPELSVSSKNPFSRMTSCHRRALVDARNAHAAVVFLCADHVVSAGALAAVVRRHEAGSRAVVCPGLRIERESMEVALRAGGESGMTPRELVALALEHLHPCALAHLVDSPRTARNPLNAYWTVPAEGIVARCYQLHPLMVDPLCPEVLPEGTIDGHYVTRACPLRSQVHLVSDSDELVLFEISNAIEAVPGTARGRQSRWRVASMLGRCDSHQRSYWNETVRLHVGELSDGWVEVEQRASRFARQVVLLCLARRCMAGRHLAGLLRRDGLLGKPLRTAFRARAKRLRRSASIATHAVAQAAHRLQKRVSRAGRRAMHRVRSA